MSLFRSCLLCCLSISQFQVLSDVVKVDRVDEFSVIPSANPVDHFTPQQAIESTSVGLDRLPATAPCQPRLIQYGDLKLYAMGAQKGPHTLVISIEMVCRIYKMIQTNVYATKID